MKKFAFLLAAMFMAAISINAQVDIASEAPESVTSSFDAKFAGASGVEWAEENGMWEAEFVLAEQTYEATFGSDGSWMKTEQEIASEEVPPSITSSLELDMPGFEIQEVDIVETPVGKFYEMNLLVGAKKMKVVTDLDGKIVKKDAGQDDN